MRRLLTGSEMEELERHAMRKQGLSVETLMQRAAAAVAARVREMAPSGPIAIVAGKGNNGGDGRLAAGMLAEEGLPVRLVDLADETPVADLSARLASALDGAAIVVDALFGFSLHGAPRPPADEAVRAIDAARSRGAAVLAVDIPSGVEAHSGHVHGAAVRADETLTFSAMKVGLALEPGRSHAGQVRVIDIGIDPARVAKSGDAFEVEAADVAAMLPRRLVDCHKKSCGRVLVVGGSQGMSGSVCMVGEAALRSGAGMVELAVPASLVPIVETKITETVTIPLSETFARSVDSMAVDAVLDLLSEFDILVLGPGLSLNDSTAEFVHEVVASSALPLVLDADGLNAMVGHTDAVALRRAPTVLTPHPGEMARLAGAAIADVQHDRPGFVRSASRDLKAVTVLKGAVTLVSDGELMAVNPTGNPGMATMGSGDVLTGVIAGLMAQGVEPFAAAQAGVWIHGAAGDLAARELSEYGVIAGDILARLPRVFAGLVEGEGGGDGCNGA